MKSIADFSRRILSSASLPAALLCAGLAGCGQTGPLYMPAKPAPVTTPASAPVPKPSAAPGTQAPVTVTPPVPASR